MQAIEISPTGYLELRGVATGELRAGFCVQMWICLGSVQNPGVLFEIGQEHGARLVLALATGGALELRHAGQTITVPGAVGAGRWTHVAAELAADGFAAIFIDGFRAATGVLPQLGDVARERVRIGDPQLGASFAVADVWLLARVRTDSECAASARPQGPLAHYPGELVGSEVRGEGPLGHARVVGAAEVIAADDIDALADARPGSVVWSEPQDALELPSLSTDFTRGITIEAWLRPQARGQRMTVLELGDTHELIRLDIEPVKGLLQLSFEDVTSKPRWLELIGVVRPNAWQHVCVTVSSAGRCEVYIDARLVHEVQLAAPASTRDGARRRCRIGREFLGELAELRVWQAARAPQELRTTWLRRARGDEPRLVVCYHLDTLEQGLAFDAGARRLHARPQGRLAYDDGLGLPLRASVDRRRIHIRTVGKLLLDELPLSLFPSQQVTKTPPFTAMEYGRVEGTRVHCAVYEVAIEPYAGDGSKLAGEVEIGVDATVRVVRTDGGKPRIEEWRPGTPQRLAVSSSGRARVRVLAAKSLDCPVLRMRMAGMDEDCWVLVRPADIAQQQLAGLHGSTLKHPPTGKRPVLRSDLPDDDADAIANFLRDVGRVIPQAPRAGAIPKGQKSTWSTIWGPIEDAADVVGDFVLDIGGGVAKLTIAFEQQAQDLARKAAGATVQVGEAAIRGNIENARSLAADGASAAWGGITLVGEIVVDGVKQTFRTVVVGVLDVVDAIESFLRRIGAALIDFIEFLAMLFDWERFLAASDEMYDLALRHLRGLSSRIEDVRQAPAIFDELVATPCPSALAGKTLGELFGLDLGDVAIADELNYLIDVTEEAFSSSPPNTKDDPQRKATPSEVSQSELEAADEGVHAGLPPELLSWSRSVLDLPADMIFELPKSTWDAGRPVLTSMADWLADELDGLLVQAERTLTSRLDVPYLRDTIEVVVLRGRKLDLLRLVALMAAVPVVLHDTNKSTVKTNDHEDDARKLRWTQCAFGIASAIVLIGRTVGEYKNHRLSMCATGLAGGAMAMVMGGLDIGLAAISFEDAKAQAFGLSHGVLSTIGGGWMIASSLFALPPESAEVEKFRVPLDAVMEVVIAIGEGATTIAAYTFARANDEDLGITLGFRLCSGGIKALYRLFDGLDNTKVPALSYVSGGCAGLLALIDLTDMVLAIVDYAGAD